MTETVWFECPMCKEHYQAIVLEWHMEVKHGFRIAKWERGAIKSKCRLCDTVFKNQDELVAHISSLTQEEMEFHVLKIAFLDRMGP